MSNELKKRQQKLIELFDKAPMKKTFSMELSYNKDGNAVFEMPYNPGFDHALNQVHGGVIATLIDNAGWFTAASKYSTWVGTADMQVRLLEPVEKKKLIATGSMIKEGNKIAMTEMKVKTEDGQIVAVGSGTFVVTSVPY